MTTMMELHDYNVLAPDRHDRALDGQQLLVDFPGAPTEETEFSVLETDQAGVLCGSSGEKTPYKSLASSKSVELVSPVSMDDSASICTQEIFEPTPRQHDTNLAKPTASSSSGNLEYKLQERSSRSLPLGGSVPMLHAPSKDTPLKHREPHGPPKPSKATSTENEPSIVPGNFHSSAESRLMSNIQWRRGVLGRNNSQRGSQRALLRGAPPSTNGSVAASGKSASIGRKTPLCTRSMPKRIRSQDPAVLPRSAHITARSKPRPTRRNISLHKNGDAKQQQDGEPLATRNDAITDIPAVGNFSLGSFNLSNLTIETDNYHGHSSSVMDDNAKEKVLGDMPKRSSTTTEPSANRRPVESSLSNHRSRSTSATPRLKRLQSFQKDLPSSPTTTTTTTTNSGTEQRQLFLCRSKSCRDCGTASRTTTEEESEPRRRSSLARSKSCRGSALLAPENSKSVSRSQSSSRNSPPSRRRRSVSRQRQDTTRPRLSRSRSIRHDSNGSRDRQRQRSFSANPKRRSETSKLKQPLKDDHKSLSALSKMPTTSLNADESVSKTSVATSICSSSSSGDTNNNSAPGCHRRAAASTMISRDDHAKKQYQHQKQQQQQPRKEALHVVVSKHETLKNVMDLMASAR